MLRRFGAGLAAVALVCGCAAAPFTHAHAVIDSVSDAHHPRGHALVHAHATPHAHDHDAERAGAGATATGQSEERIWSVASFVFPQTAAGHADAPAMPVSAQPSIELSSGWLGVHRLRPQAHGPPVAWSSPLRAPPVLPPAIA